MIVADLKVYRVAKKACTDLPDAIVRIDQSVFALSPYKKYPSVARMIDQLLQGRFILSQNLILAKEAVAKKARVK